MDPINSAPSLDAQIYAMKKAIDVQGQGVMKVLESAAPSNTSTGSSVTGLGQTLDIRA
ncbi:MAG: hypothetical protein PHW18_06240 [Sulfuricurvum sp.]|uniref:hypothetical protein n=1 Tax=Sulfuricurvum sp. TaxID=2025608 RepID=UPI00260D5F95|nr:hypothetical protein [Sulfuricurvum sp.]MDD2829155.1 hypothetical protein [Sulfuricurvum sp.]MDD4950204.1 hypothetical protein [Sulfuricurvum sp.]